MDLILNLANVAIFILILVGVIKHHNRRFHVRTMFLCFALDLALLLIVELRSQAVEAALKSTSMMLMVHIGFSLLMLVLWIWQIVVGVKILKGRMELLPRHASMAKVFLLARFGNLVTAFLVG